jgi:HK97 family phage major capsid protein
MITEIPTTPAELAEFIADRKACNEVLNNEDKTLWPKLMTQYANQVAKRDPDIEREVAEQAERFLAKWAEEQGKGFNKEFQRGHAPTPAELRAGKQTAASYARTPQKALDGQFEHLIEFFDAINNKADTGDAELMAKRKLVQNAMSSTDPGSGGFLIPEEFRAELLRVALESAVVRPRARVIPMTSLRVSIPFLDVTSNQTSIYGGVVGYWTEEGAALTQSQPSFGRVSLEAKKLVTYTEIPNELRQDSAVSAEAFVNEAFPIAIAWYEDVAFLVGSGAGEPLGVLNSQNGGLVSQTKEVGQSTSTILYENMIGMYSRMLPGSLSSAVWVVSPDAFTQLATMALNVGTGGSAIWLNNAQAGPPASFLGRPIVISEKVNSTSNSANVGGAGVAGSDVNFVDFGQYLIGDRMAMSAVSSTDFRFGTDVTAYRVIERLDGRPWMQSPITPRNGGPTLSPYVMLGAR